MQIVSGLGTLGQKTESYRDVFFTSMLTWNGPVIFTDDRIFILDVICPLHG